VGGRGRARIRGCLGKGRRMLPLCLLGKAGDMECVWEIDVVVI
jgi:hypothetical protein